MDMKNKRINVQKFNLPEIKEEFKLVLRNRFSILEALTDTGIINRKWTQVKGVFIETSEKILGFKERNRKAWITEETWKMIQERKKAKGKLNGYQENDRDRLVKEYYVKVH
jgi:F0F1-type ATP synthase beta subunit